MQYLLSCETIPAAFHVTWDQFRQFYPYYKHIHYILYICIHSNSTKKLQSIYHDREFPLGQRSWGNEPAIWRLKHRNFQNSILFTPSHILCQPPLRGMNRTKGSEACDQSLHSKDQFSTWLRAFPSLSHSETRTRMAVIYPFIFYELISLWWQMLRYLDDV